MTYYQRRLPHWIPDAVPVFVTWRLAGTLPYGHLNTGKQFVLADQIWDRAATGPTWLKEPRVAQMIVDTLRYGAATKKFYDLHAYVVMPNHVHVVWLPLVGMHKTTRWVKSVTARRAKHLLGLPPGPFWQNESYDHWIRSSSEWRKVVHYVEWNPVKAGFTQRMEDWPSSSA